MDNKNCSKCGREIYKYYKSYEEQFKEQEKQIKEYKKLGKEILPKKGGITLHSDSGILLRYRNEAKNADLLYKAYVTGGVSRLEKVNGRFLASQTLKLDYLIDQNDTLIGQNNKIIELLEKIAEKSTGGKDEQKE